MIGLIDTNLFKKITKNLNNIHENFLRNVENNFSEIFWTLTPFGWLEYLGLTFRGLINIDQMTSGWVMPKEAQKEYAKTIEVFGLELSSQIHWVRSNAKEKFDKLLTTEIINTKAINDQSYHSDIFTKGPLSYPLFTLPLKHFQANNISELLSIDYLYRYHEFSDQTSQAINQMGLLAVLAEYYKEKRNIVLFRGFKKTWFSRIIGDHENIVSPKTMERLNRSISRLKNDADRFDHDLLSFFLLGYAVMGEYQPVIIFTQDEPDEILCRLSIFLNIITQVWKDFQFIDGIGDIPLQLNSKYIFVSDSGEFDYDIGYQELGRFLRYENLIVKL